MPELGISGIKVKVDTGARTSALHAFNVRPMRKDGEDWVRFEVHPIQRNDALSRPCLCRALDYRWVTNSGGRREKRFVIRTPIRLGDQEWPIEVTLTDRDQMGFRMLLGRTAITKRFVVDPARSFCLGRAGRRKKNKKKKSKPRTGKRSPKGASEEE